MIATRSPNGKQARKTNGSPAPAPTRAPGEDRPERAARLRPGHIVKDNTTRHACVVWDIYPNGDVALLFPDGSIRTDPAGAFQNEDIPARGSMLDQAAAGIIAEVKKASLPTPKFIIGDHARDESNDIEGEVVFYDGCTVVLRRADGSSWGTYALQVENFTR